MNVRATRAGWFRVNVNVVSIGVWRSRRRVGRLPVSRQTLCDRRASSDAC